MNQLEKFAEVTTFLFDVDGVFTDSNVMVLESGKLLRQMSTRDGLAVKMAVAAGYRIAVITGGKSEGVKKRLTNLGVPATDIYLGVSDKLEKYEEIVDTYDLDEEKIMYMGDDLPDYPVMRRVGFPVCPADAVPEIRKLSLYVSAYKGGAGCVREVLEKTMKIQGSWQPFDNEKAMNV